MRRSEALRILRDPDRYTVDDPRFSTARVVGPSMLSTDGAEHDRHRAPFARQFRRDRIAELEPWVAAEAHRLIDALRSPAELRTQFAGPLAAKTMAHILGLDHVPVARVLEWYSAIVAATTGDTPEAPGRAAFAALSEAMDLPAAGELTAEQVASNAGVLLFGGIETTEGMIVNAVWHLLTHANALARVREDPALIANAVEESLRLEPAAAVVDRYEKTAHPPGRLVRVSLHEANRDPDTFAEPDAFDLDRDNAHRHITFAAGPHVCLGMHLARLEARVALSALLERLDGLTLAAETAPEGVIFRKVIDLRVNFAGSP